MKKPYIALFAALALSTAGVYFTMQSMHHDARAMDMGVKAGTLKLAGATARFIIADRPGAVFLTIENTGDADKLIAASSPIADKVELHSHTMDNGVMKMRPVEAIDVAANATTELKSGGFHIMMFGVKELPANGTMISLTLTFEKAGKVNIEAMAGEPGASHSHSTTN